LQAIQETALYIEAPSFTEGAFFIPKNQIK